MKISRYALFAIFAGAFCPSHAQDARPATLKVGDVAPEVEVIKWLRGAPLNLKDGKVHVVEFWATWCEPCKAGMPHLSNLAKKYKGKVQFTGFSILENGQNQLERVEKFVASAGDSITYDLAYAGDNRCAMTKNWLQAAKIAGIPAAFIVDKRGIIAWIGHPVEGMEEALQLALKDQLTPEAGAKLAAEYKQKVSGAPARAQQREAEGKAGNVAKLQELVHEATDLQFLQAESIVSSAYVTIANAHPEEAKEFGKFILEEYGNAPNVMIAVANAISGDGSRITSTPDLVFASKVMARAAATKEVDRDFYLLSARTAFLAKDYDTAVKSQTRAIEATKVMHVEMEQFLGNGTQQQKDFLPQLREGMKKEMAGLEKTLEEYKAAAAGK